MKKNMLPILICGFFLVTTLLLESKIFVPQRLRFLQKSRFMDHGVILSSQNYNVSVTPSVQNKREYTF